MAELEIFKLYLLVLVRVSGLVATAPILSSNNFPVLAKLGLSGLLASAITPTLPAMDATLPGEPLPFALMAVGELIIGMVIGLVMQLLFAAIQVAGQVMDMQSGFGLINVFNPALETQFPLFGFLFFILAILYLLVSYGHHMIIRALSLTFDRIPVGGFAPDTPVLAQFVAWGGLMFHDAILLAAPVTAAMMLAYITMGLMGRVIPQINLFVVGFPLTIALSLLVVAISIGYYLDLLDVLFTDMFRNVERIVPGLG